MAAPRGSARERYAIGSKVGEGAFSSVFCARDRASGAKVALKRIRVNLRRGQDANAILREMQVLRLLEGVSPHVMPLLGAHTRTQDLVLVMPFIPCSLHEVLTNRDVPLPEPHVACLSKMLLSGLGAIHAEGLVHRDIKPANLLIAADGTLLLADFGQGRELPSHHDASLSHAVATRWYRAPELLFASRSYGPGVDVWASGCVIAQLLTLSPLLPGQSDIDQLLTVIRFLGSPTPDRWPGVEKLPDYGKIELPADLSPIPLAVYMPLASAPAVAFVASMLKYEAAERAAPRDALRSHWIRCARCQPPTRAELLLSTKDGGGSGTASRSGDGLDPGDAALARPTAAEMPPIAFPCERICRRAPAFGAGVKVAHGLRTRLAAAAGGESW